MPRNVEIKPGYVVEFPDSMGDDAINASAAQLYGEAKPGSAPPSTGDTLRNVLQWGGKVIAGLTGMNEAGRDAVDHPIATLATAAIPGAAKAGAAAIPSRTRAAANFQAVMAAAKNEPIDIVAPGGAALRIMQLAERGGTMPKVVRDFLRRVTDPEKGHLVYEEARDFASNISRLSADEFNRLTPALRREVGNLRTALNKSVEDATAAVGKREQYLSAMREYARRSQIDSAVEDVVKGAKRALPYVTGAGLGYGVAKKVGDLIGGE